MQLEVGTILEGKVTGILKFGAFVDLGGGKSGMVHISEVAQTYVNDIKEHLHEGDVVKVKIISIAEDGKISLSIKKALPQPERSEKRERQGGKGVGKQFNKPRQNDFSAKDKDDAPRVQHHAPKKPVKKEHLTIEDFEGVEYAYEPKSTVTDAGFEDMLAKFKMSSEDRQSGLKNMDVKKRGRRK